MKHQGQTMSETISMVSLELASMWLSFLMVATSIRPGAVCGETGTLYRRSGPLLILEMKLTATPDPEGLARLDRTADLIKADKRILVSRVPRSDADARRVSCNLPWLLDPLADL